MARQLRVILLQLLLIAGFSASGSPLLAATALSPANDTASLPCLDCPPPDDQHTANCCIQTHQGCSSCSAVDHGLVSTAGPVRQTGFAEPPAYQSGLVYAPLKPPPRTYLKH